MALLLDAVLDQASNGSPTTVAPSSESVAVLLFASGLLSQRRNWLDKAEDQLDEVTDADWDQIETLIGNLYEEIMNPEIGAIFPYITADPPENCLICDGATYDRVDYPLLYDALDSVFVIDADTFFLPDLRSRVPVGAGEGTGLSAYAVNDTGGEEAHQLTTAELASHQHGLFTTDGLAVAPGELAVKIPFITVIDLTDLEGGDEPHENRQPFVALNYCVRVS